MAGSLVPFSAFLLLNATAAIGQIAAPPPMWTLVTTGSDGDECSPDVALGSSSSDDGVCALLSSSTLQLDRESDAMLLKQLQPGGSFGGLSDLVRLRNAQDAVFFTTTAGGLYGYKLPNVDVLWPPVDTRRTGCSSDMLAAGPAVQLKYRSNAGFTYDDDVVFVITDDGCADFTNNRIIAYAASTASQVWAFNDGGLGGSYAVGPGYSRCAVGYDRNLLYCATYYSPDKNPGDGFDKTVVWALDTTTGTPAWERALPGTAPGIFAPPTPVLVGNRVYEIARSDNLHVYALDADSGVVGWDLSVAGTDPVGDIAADTRPDQPWLIFSGNSIADSSGALYRITDAGTSATVNGMVLVSNVSLATGPVVVRGTGRVYVEDSNATVYEYAAASLTGLGVTAVHATSGALSGNGASVLPALEADQSTIGGPVDRLMVQAQAETARYAIPWLAPDLQADLAISITSPAPAISGDVVVYTITVTNLDAPDTTWATGVQVTFAPQALTAVTVQPSQGTGYDLGDLGPGATATITVTGIAGQQTGTFFDLVGVSADETDPDSADNVSQATTTIVADLIFADGFQ